MLSYLIIIFNLKMKKKYYLLINSMRYLTFIFLFFTLMISCEAIDCSAILNLLYNTLGVDQIITKNIVNTYGSNAVIERSFVTTPVGLYYLNQDSLYSHFSLNIFYLVIPEGVVFGKNGNTIGALFCPQSLVPFYNNKITDFLDQTPYSIVDFSYLAKMFNFINVIEKKVGCSVDGAYQLDSGLLIYMQFPFIFKVFHPSMPSEMQSVISMETAQFGFNPSIPSQNTLSGRSSRDILMKHSVYDTFGIENPVIGIYKDFFEETIGVELRCLLPGIDIFTSSIGGEYSRSLSNKIQKNYLRYLLESMINNPQNKPLDYEVLKNNILTAVDRIIYSGYYLPYSYDPFSLSPSIILKIPLGKGFFINTYLSYIYSFSKERKGVVNKEVHNIFLEPINIDNLQTQKACNLLDLLLQDLSNKIIPTVAEGYFFPGYQLQGNIVLKTVVSDMSISLGADMWFKSASMFTTNFCEKSVYYSDLSSACQLNGFVNIELYRDFFCFPITFSFAAQASVYAEGIGKEFGGKIQLSTQY